MTLAHLFCWYFYFFVIVSFYRLAYADVWSTYGDHTVCASAYSWAGAFKQIGQVSKCRVEWPTYIIQFDDGNDSMWQWNGSLSSKTLILHLCVCGIWFDFFIGLLLMTYRREIIMPIPSKIVESNALEATQNEEPRLMLFDPVLRAWTDLFLVESWKWKLFFSSAWGLDRTWLTWK